MCGVGVVLSRRHFWNFIALVVIRGLLSRMLCTFLTKGFTRIFNFLGMPKIGNWNIFTFFLDLINSMPLNGEGHDKLCWKPARNKSFKVSEYYFSLSSNPNTVFPWKPVQRSKNPLRVAFFSWTPTLGKILTLENL